MTTGITPPNELIYVTDDQEALNSFLNSAKAEISRIKEVQAFDLFTTTTFKLQDKNMVVASVDEKYGYILLPSLPNKDDYKEIDSIIDFNVDKKYIDWLKVYIDRCRVVRFGEDAKYPCVIEDEDTKAPLTVRYNCNMSVKMYKLEDVMHEVPKDVKFL